MKIIYVLIIGLLVSGCQTSTPCQGCRSYDWPNEGPVFYPNEEGGAQRMARDHYGHKWDPNQKSMYELWLEGNQ